MATANDNSRKRAQDQNEDKGCLILDVMELVDDMRNKIDLVLEDFLLQYHSKIQPQKSSIIVVSKQQLEQHRKLSMQRIQNKIELEAFQHKQKMKLLQAKESYN